MGHPVLLVQLFYLALLSCYVLYNIYVAMLYLIQDVLFIHLFYLTVLSSMYLIQDVLFIHLFY